MAYKTLRSSGEYYLIFEMFGIYNICKYFRKSNYFKFLRVDGSAISFFRGLRRL